MKLLEAIEGLVSGEGNIIKIVLSILRLEATLAGRSIIPLLINVGMLVVLLFSFWLSLMILLGYACLWMFGSLWATLLFILVLHVGVALGLLKYLQFNIKNISFEKTRAFFSNQEDDLHEDLAKTINYSDRRYGKTAKPPKVRSKDE